MRSNPDGGDEGVDDGPAGADGGGNSGGDGRRDVVVPMRLYKTVTVFSTLIAVAGVVLGFVLLDAATLQWSVLRQFVAGTLARLGVAVAPEVLSTALALLGLGVIGFGAGVYVLGTRFRARGMGNSQEDANEDTDNG